MSSVVFLVIALGLAAFSLLAHAATGEKTLRLAPKEAIATTLPHRHAPFLARHDDEQDNLDFVPHPESRRGNPSSCNSERPLCYDPTNGHIVYKPARQLMPDIPGLQRENISVRRDRIVLRYSF